MPTFVRFLALFLVLLPFRALPQTATNPPRSFSASLNATGATQSFYVVANLHTVQVVVVSPGACTMHLEGSLDKQHWNDLSGDQPCLVSTMWHVTDRLVTYARVVLTAYSGDQAGAAVQVLYTGVVK
jgi:hypothetical protein